MTNLIQEPIALALLGLLFGSFAGAVSYRLPRGYSILGRSKCPNCDTVLSVLRLVPVISYIFLLGRCHNCRVRISARYIIIELLTATMFFFVATNVDNIFQKAVLCLTVVCMVIIIITDFELYIIPDVMQFIMAFLGILFAFFAHYPLIQVLISPIICYLIGVALKIGFKFSMKRDGLGYGDVKLLAVSGIYLNITQIASFLFLSGIIGILTAIIWRLLGKGEVFPFGPSLITSLYLCLLFPAASNIANFMVYL